MNVVLEKDLHRIIEILLIHVLKLRQDAFHNTALYYQPVCPLFPVPFLKIFYFVFLPVKLPFKLLFLFLEIVDL